MTYRPPILIQGNTQVIHELHPVEQAAGLSACWLPNGRVWRAEGELPEPDDEAGRWPRHIAYPIIIMLSLAIWVGVIGLCFWAAR